MSLLSQFQTVENQINKAVRWCDYVIQHKLPYTQVEYIQGTGTQWINLNFKPTSITAVEVSFKNPSVNSWEQVFGTVSDHEFGFRQNSSSTNSYRWAVNGSDAYSTINASSTFHIVKLTGTGYYYVDGVQGGKINKTAPGNNVLRLFKGNNEVGVLMIKYCKVWQNNILTMDLIPVKNESETVCMYDKLNEIYYYNAGSGSFIAGPEII